MVTDAVLLVALELPLLDDDEKDDELVVKEEDDDEGERQPLPEQVVVVPLGDVDDAPEDDRTEEARVDDEEKLAVEELDEVPRVIA